MDKLELIFRFSVDPTVETDTTYADLADHIIDSIWDEIHYTGLALQDYEIKEIEE